jgi:hypothetical protein
MSVRKALIAVAGVMTAGVVHSSVAYAEDAPSNAELFRMLKAQQQTISELRSELKQAKQERAAGTSERREVQTVARQAAKEAARDAAREAVAATAPPDAYAMRSSGPAVRSPARGMYVSAFGGGAFGGSSNVTQFGTVFFTEAQGGPLAVNAPGRTGNSTVAFGGAHVGYEWAYGAYLLPAVEFEGLYLARNRQRATLQNSTDRVPEQTFDNTLPTSTAVALANVVVGFRTPYQGVTPYVGGGIGAARVSVSGASSSQTNPPESGVDHFNTDPNSVAWTFAAQAKAGVRLALGNSGAYVFGEYRFLYVGSNDQIFGNTSYPTHSPTTAWTTRFGDTHYHLAAGGVGFSF